MIQVVSMDFCHFGEVETKYIHKKNLKDVMANAKLFPVSNPVNTHNNVIFTLF